MNKEHFLTELKIHLKALPPQQLAYILKMYNDKFDKHLADGTCEVVISQELGNPRELATQILEEFGIDHADEKQPYDEWQEFTSPRHETPYHSYYERPKPTSFFVRFCQVTGVLLFNFLFMIWILLSAFLVLFSGWLVAVIFLLLPIAGIIAFITTSGAFGLFQLFFSILFCGVGLIGLAILIPLTKYSLRFNKLYVEWTFNTLRGRH